MSDDKRPSEPGGLLTHMPLPYVVRLRLTAGDDASPVIRESKVVAYSVFEAVMQTNIEAGGSGVNDEKVTIEEVRPDVEAYGALFKSELAIALQAHLMKGSKR